MLRKRISCAPYICLLKMRFTVLHCMLRIGLLVWQEIPSIIYAFLLLNVIQRAKRAIVIRCHSMSFFNEIKEFREFNDLCLSLNSLISLYSLNSLSLE